MNQHDEKVWIKKAKSGDEKAYKVLYDRYCRDLFVICLRYSDDRVQAQDYLQDAFIKIFCNIEKFNDELGAFIQWAKRVTINVCLSAIRSKKMNLVPISALECKETEATDVLAQLHIEEMMELIQQLPIGYRTVFNLYVIDGYTHKEIAQALNIAEGTSKTQLMKARAYLQQLILKKRSTIYERYG